MSNVIIFNAPPRPVGLHAQGSDLLRLFARNRRGADDVFWLKENAELLSILQCTGAGIAPDALIPFVQFYDTIAERISFFPQYYRFLLSIALDLEDMGMPGTTGARLCKWVQSQRLVAAEMSDLQRAEARRLLARRGVTCADPELDRRLRKFISHSDTFAVPNKKAAYELTHIVFYLSDYGRKNPYLDKGALRSLQFAGILAYLDQNADLLAEVCTALRYAGQTPSAIWENWVCRQLQGFSMTTADTRNDDYHAFLVGHWMALCAGRPVCNAAIGDQFTTFTSPRAPVGPLRHISARMYQMKSMRTGDWGHMQSILEQSVDEDGFDILSSARHSSTEFDAFFQGFSRISIAV